MLLYMSENVIHQSRALSFIAPWSNSDTHAPIVGAFLLKDTFICRLVNKHSSIQSVDELLYHTVTVSLSSEETQQSIQETWLQQEFYLHNVFT